MLGDRIDLTGFDPSGERAAGAAARMRAHLATSLRYIIAEAQGHIAIPTAMDDFFARLAAGPVSPAVFGIYCDLVLALDDNELGEAERLLREIVDTPDPTAALSVIDLGDPRYDRASNRIRRLVDTDPATPVSIFPPAAAAAATARALIAKALSLLDAGNPALAAEIRGLLREIVLAAGTSAKPDAIHFEGVSSFLLWGAVVLDPGASKTALDMVQTLAHESGHNLLFALSADGPLHETPSTELYPSPLRSDPRPMDGIVHATYVTARMHQSVLRLLDAGVLDAEESAEARASTVTNARRYATGRDIVRKHARLTPRGETVLAGSDRYMAAYL